MNFSRTTRRQTNVSNYTTLQLDVKEEPLSQKCVAITYLGQNLWLYGNDVLEAGHFSFETFVDWVLYLFFFETNIREKVLFFVNNAY